MYVLKILSFYNFWRENDSDKRPLPGIQGAEPSYNLILDLKLIFYHRMLFRITVFDSFA